MLIKPKSDFNPPTPVNPTEAKKKLEEKMTQIKLNELERLTQNRATSMGLPYIALGSFPISEEALTLISEEESQASKTVCFFRNTDQFRLASTDPLSKAA